jgi:hypothetical protein
MRPPLNDLAGKRFGKLSVIEFKGRARDVKKTPLWLCLCDCGSQEVVLQKKLVTGKVTECCECSRPRCEICGTKIPTDYPSKTACSDICKTRRNRARYREEYYRRLEKDPDLTRRTNARRKERAAVDPEYAARLRDYEAKALERKREKRTTDSEWAELERQRGRERYSANREDVLTRRKLRRQIDPEYRKRRRDQEKQYYLRYRNKRLATRKETWENLPSEEKARRIELKRNADRINQRRYMMEIRRDPKRYREYLAREREWERNRNLRRLFESLDKLKDRDNE